jgi:undecaprenyl phosphate N,N'-diacetylbacillosamine 1-phosphate transferase
MKYILWKRIFDLLVSVVLLVFLLPLICILVILTYFDQKCIFFRQLRIGKDNRPFYIIKFNTIIHRDGRQIVTRFADFSRSHALDEIPQLINVIYGEMSLVGPRPLYPDYLDYYNEEEKERHKVKPGITGLAQVMGGNDICWDKKLQLDLEYIRKMSFMLDLKIFLKSILYIFRKSSHWEVIPLSVERKKIQ